MSDTLTLRMAALLFARDALLEEIGTPGTASFSAEKWNAYGPAIGRIGELAQEMRAAIESDLPVAEIGPVRNT